MERKIRHNCIQNDNSLVIKISDEVDNIGDITQIEAWTSERKEGGVVIGFNDLKEGLDKAGYDLIKRD